MRLYSMSLQAIGPFAGHHTIDFSSLGRSGLFLLEGPTGSGKSTIIDAIVFALYGGVAGSAASKDRLYSHHAAVGTEPFVDLVFEVANGVYRLRRTPPYARLKRKGTGTTQQTETAILTRLSNPDDHDAAQVVSTRAQEIGSTEIPRLIGLSREQFLQTVVLPQGEFAKFLRSTGEERKALLQTIFRTDVYERLTGTLRDLRQAGQTRTKVAREAAGRALAVFAEAASVEEAEFALDDTVADLDRCGQVGTRIVEESAQAADAMTAAKKQLDDATAALTTATKLATSLQRRAELLNRREELQAQEPVVAEARTALRSGRRAAVVATAVRAAERAAKRRDEERARSDHALKQLDPAWPTAPEALADLAERTVKRLVEVERLRTTEQTFARREAELQTLQDAIESWRAKIEGLETRRRERPVERATLEAERARFHSLASTTEAAALGLSDAQRIRKHARTAEHTRIELEGARFRLADVVDAAKEAADQVHRLRLARLDGMAGELAADLVDGAPCVVCGASEHPAPAPMASDHPDGQQIAEADGHAEDLRRIATETKSLVDRLESMLESARDSAGHRSIEEADSLVTAAEERAREAAAAAATLTGLNEALSRFDEETESMDKAVNDAQVELTRLRERFSALEEGLDSDRREVGETLGEDAASLTALAGALTEQRITIESFLAAHRALSQALTEAEDASADLAAQLAEYSFADIEQVQRAALPAARLTELEDRVRIYERDRAVVDAGLAEPSVAGLRGDEQANVEAARLARDRLADEHEERVAEASSAAQRAKRVTTRLASLRTACATLASADEEASDVIRIARLAEADSPQNTKGITLGTYVLMRRFEEVVRAANARLGPMSDGRYRLRATEEKERSGRARKTGLSLAIVDAETGREREPRTLSGGETFYTSLSLALGLADVVTGEAGGIELSTLFVDEGFGSLDPATLEDVMVELTNLSKAGRCVGIVSHVEELKQRVPERIEVQQRGDGSSTLRVLA